MRLERAPPETNWTGRIDHRRQHDRLVRQAHLKKKSPLFLHLGACRVRISFETENLAVSRSLEQHVGVRLPPVNVWYYITPPSGRSLKENLNHLQDSLSIPGMSATTSINIVPGPNLC